MSFSYSGDPSASALDAARFSLQDTNPQAPLFSDAEINYLLVLANGNATGAAIRGIEFLIAGGAGTGFCDETVGSVSISFSQRLDNLIKILPVLRARYAMSSGVRLFSGGVDLCDAVNRATDPTKVRPGFQEWFEGSRRVPLLNPLLGGAGTTGYSGQ